MEQSKKLVYEIINMISDSVFGGLKRDEDYRRFQMCFDSYLSRLKSHIVRSIREKWDNVQCGFLSEACPTLFCPIENKKCILVFHDGIMEYPDSAIIGLIALQVAFMHLYFYKYSTSSEFNQSAVKSDEVRNLVIEWGFADELNSAYSHSDKLDRFTFVSKRMSVIEDRFHKIMESEPTHIEELLIKRRQ